MPSLFDWLPSPRLKTFVVACLITLVTGLLFVFLRPPIYRASAVLLTTPLPAPDQNAIVAIPQHVAIQQDLLTGLPLVEETLKRLETRGIVSTNETTPEKIKAMLKVESVPETNLVELVAEGSQQTLLAPLVNTWIDVYLGTSAKQIQNSTAATLHALHNELASLTNRIATKKAELERFRQQNDIASFERVENDAMARLAGLTESLNTASDAEIQAKARLEVLRKDILDGKPVVPESDQRVLATLVTRAQALREELTALRQRFTGEYIRLHPEYRTVPIQLRDVENKIKVLTEQGKKIVLAQAERDYASARQATETLRQQLQEQKRLAGEFSSRFAEYQALQMDLGKMEETRRELADRLTRLESRQLEDYPAVKVVERAYPPVDPIRPHYWRDATLVALTSLVLGVLAVWLRDYLTQDDQVTHESPRVTLAGVHVYPSRDSHGLESRANPPAFPQMPESSKPLAELSKPDAREMNRWEIEALLEAARPETRRTIALLLSGLEVEEIPHLDSSAFDLDDNLIIAPFPPRRKLPLPPRLKQWIGDNGGSLSPLPDQEDLAKQIYLTAVEAGLQNPETISPATLRHTYLVYLLRQGLKLAKLEKIAGPLPLDELTRYRRYTSAHTMTQDANISLIHPCLQL